MVLSFGDPMIFLQRPISLCILIAVRRADPADRRAAVPHDARRGVPGMIRACLVIEMVARRDGGALPLPVGERVGVRGLRNSR